MKEVFKKEKPIKVHVAAYNYRGGLTELAKEVVNEEKKIASQKRVGEKIQFIGAKSMRSYLAKKTREAVGHRLERSERLKAIYHWAYGDTEKLEAMTNDS